MSKPWPIQIKQIVGMVKHTQKAVLSPWLWATKNVITKLQKTLETKMKLLMLMIKHKVPLLINRHFIIYKINFMIILNANYLFII